MAVSASQYAECLHFLANALNAWNLTLTVTLIAWRHVCRLGKLWTKCKTGCNCVFMTEAISDYCVVVVLSVHIERQQRWISRLRKTLRGRLNWVPWGVKYHLFTYHEIINFYFYFYFYIFITFFIIVVITIHSTMIILLYVWVAMPKKTSAEPEKCSEVWVSHFEYIF